MAAEIRRVTKDKWAYRELLLLADPDEAMVGKYLEKGDMYVLFAGGEAVCEAVVTERDDGCVEVKNLATREDMQGKGYGRRMLEYVFSVYEGKSPAVYVGTGDVRAGFYEKLGFKRDYVVKNFFPDNYPEPIVDEGVLCVDMLYLKRAL